MADYVRGHDILSALKYYFFKRNPENVADIADKLAECHNIMEVLRVGLDAEAILGVGNDTAQNPVELLNALGDVELASMEIPGGVMVGPGQVTGDPTY